MQLQAIGTPGEGALEVDYGVVFSARVRLALDVGGRTVSWEGPIPYVPMFDVRAMGRTPFDPWAWSPVSAMGRTMRARVADVALTDAIVRIPGISGGFTFEASGEVSASYHSTQISFGIAADPITAMTLRRQAIFNAGPFVEYSPRLEGDVAYAGAIHVYPGLYVSLAGRRWMLDLADIPIPVGPFPRHVLFDPSLARLGLPDVRVEPATIDFGDVDLGRMTERTVELRNDGEGDGRVLSAETESPFAVMSRVSPLPARSRSSFVVGFAPVRPGPVSGELVVTTNDPDTPRVRVRLRANGVGVEMPPVLEDAGVADASDAAPTPTGENDGGCGCRAQGEGRGAGGFAWALVAMAVMRRRRAKGQGRVTSKRIL
jgi:MYXO-CTERM domain-containing protein